MVTICRKIFSNGAKHGVSSSRGVCMINEGLEQILNLVPSKQINMLLNGGWMASGQYGLISLSKFSILNKFDLFIG